MERHSECYLVQRIRTRGKLVDPIDALMIGKSDMSYPFVTGWGGTCPS